MKNELKIKSLYGGKYFNINGSVTDYILLDNVNSYDDSYINSSSKHDLSMIHLFFSSMILH